MTELTARSVSVAFGSGAAGHLAVADVSLRVGHGECLGVVGESGSGKTTLARVIAGLHKPIAGEVRLDDRPVVSAAGIKYESRDRRRVQMVFQDPYDALNPHLRAVETVSEALRFWSDVSRRGARDRAYELLASVGIPRRQADCYPRQLSGGQRQRVSVVRALAPEPDVLVADEPTSSIDQSAQAQLLNIFRNLIAERGLGLIFISHDLSVVGYLSNRVLVMRAGEAIEEGDTVDVLSKPVHEYTQSLLDSVPGRSRTR